MAGATTANSVGHRRCQPLLILLLLLLDDERVTRCWAAKAAYDFADDGSQGNRGQGTT